MKITAINNCLRSADRCFVSGSRDFSPALLLSGSGPFAAGRSIPLRGGPCPFSVLAHFLRFKLIRTRFVICSRGQRNRENIPTRGRTSFGRAPITPFLFAIGLGHTPRKPRGSREKTLATPSPSPDVHWINSRRIQALPPLLFQIGISPIASSTFLHGSPPSHSSAKLVTVPRTNFRSWRVPK